jgi:hypothetical protein
MTNYLYITEFGDALSVNLGEDTLSDLQTLVDGFVECVPVNRNILGFDADMWVNEEGLFRQGFGRNFLASYLTGRQIVGPAVIANFTSGGKTTGLTEKQMDRVRRDGMAVGHNNGKNYSVTEAADIRFRTEVVA